jgi:Cu/Ag efflux protein CusF
MTKSRSRRALFILGLVLLFVGCKSEVPGPAAPTTKPDQTYVVRGALVIIDEQRSIAEIRHEAIPEFLDQSGKRVGMASMTMPFHVGPKVVLRDLHAGDKLEFTLEVRWGAAQELFIPTLVRLPPDTALQLK